MINNKSTINFIVILIQFISNNDDALNLTNSLTQRPRPNKVSFLALIIIITYNLFFNNFVPKFKHLWVVEFM